MNDIELGALRAAVADAEYQEWKHRGYFGLHVDPTRRAKSLKDTGQFLLRAASEAVDPLALHSWILERGFTEDEARPSGVRVYALGKEMVVAPTSPGCQKFDDYGASVTRAVIAISLASGKEPLGELLALAGDPSAWGDGGEAAFWERLLGED